MTTKLRVQKELKELSIKQENLLSFINGNEKFKKMTPTNQQLLQEQYSVMTNYRNILVLRLHYWVE